MGAVGTSSCAIDRELPLWHSAVQLTFQDGTQVVLDWHATLQPWDPVIASPASWTGWE